MKVSIAKIKIKRRMRQDLGDIASLMESIKKFGLINPIAVTEKFVLIAGYRRLMAARSLGWSEVECHVMKAPSRKEAFNLEVEENKNRKDFTANEMVKIEEEREYLYAGGFKKIVLLLKRLFKAIARWFSSIINRFRR